MRNKIINLLGFVLFFVMVRTNKQITNKCYDAKICIHNGEEKCGKDEDDKPRRFLDSCDMKEFNCLNEANFKKVDPEICENLPRIEEQISGQGNKRNVSKEEEDTEKKNESIKTIGADEENGDVESDHEIVNGPVAVNAEPESIEDK